MKKAFFLIAALAGATANARPTEMPPFPSGFASHTVQAGGRTIYYRIGGSGPAVLLLHGYGDTGQMWSALAPLMAAFAKAVAVNVRTSVIPDSGHWLMDENPAATIAALSAFLAER
jgi:pimeloyl-ACP methyl ester carboxylesterase